MRWSLVNQNDQHWCQLVVLRHLSSEEIICDQASLFSGVRKSVAAPDSSAATLLRFPETKNAWSQVTEEREDWGSQNQSNQFSVLFLHNKYQTLLWRLCANLCIIYEFGAPVT